MNNCSQDITLQIGQRSLTARILSPEPANLAENPLLLLHFASSKESALSEEPYSETTRVFLGQGHRVLSFDLPDHGTRVQEEYGSGISGFCKAFIQGDDHVALFIEDAHAAIDHCLEAGLASPDRIVACGTSRAAYLTLRLLAADRRIAAAAAIAPVTDWRALSEFQEVAGRDDVAALRLTQYAEQLTGKPIYMVIGNDDARVSTVDCCRLYIELAEANLRQGHTELLVHFQVLDEPGHVSPPAWHIEAAEFLLKKCYKE